MNLNQISIQSLLSVIFIGWQVKLKKKEIKTPVSSRCILAELIKKKTLKVIKSVIISCEMNIPKLNAD